MNNVSVPVLAYEPPYVEKRNIRAAYEPSKPTQIRGIIVIEAFGNGPDSRPSLPTNVMAVAMNANANTSGSAASPIQYAASGAEIDPTTPMTIAGL